MFNRKIKETKERIIDITRKIVEIEKNIRYTKVKINYAELILNGKEKIRYGNTLGFNYDDRSRGTLWFTTNSRDLDYGDCYYDDGSRGTCDFNEAQEKILKDSISSGQEKIDLWIEELKALINELRTLNEQLENKKSK